jgi:hypothetical protein
MNLVPTDKGAFGEYSAVAEKMAPHWFSRESHNQLINVTDKTYLPGYYQKIVVPGHPINASRGHPMEFHGELKCISIACPFDQEFFGLEEYKRQLVGCLIHEWVHELQERQNSSTYLAEKNIPSAIPQGCSDPALFWDKYYSLTLEQDAHAAQAAAEMVYSGLTEWDDLMFEKTLGWLRPLFRLKAIPEYMNKWRSAITDCAKHQFNLFLN